MDPIKEAFLKIKEEISFLKQEIDQIYTLLLDLHLKTNGSVKNDSNTSTRPTFDSTHTPTQELAPKALKEQYLVPSTGNKGVPTHTPTHQHTNKTPEKPIQLSMSSKVDQFEKIQETLDSLGNLKEEITSKLKGLTSQETEVLSAFYHLGAIGEIHHKALANHLNLSESSIRDYVNRLIKKGIPIEKKRVNNKTISLSLSSSLKSILPLETLLRIRAT